MTLDPQQRAELFAIARESIDCSLACGELGPCPCERLRPDLMQPRSSFVTLRIERELRGCCGSLDAARSLAEDVWRNAWASAFKDPRFPRLLPQEWPRVELHISVLSTPEPLPVDSEAELLRELRPFVDGLIFEHGGARATFLPAVWEQLSEPLHFVRQLKLKAGWPGDFWAPGLRVFRYTAESFAEEGTSDW